MTFHNEQDAIKQAVDAGFSNPHAYSYFPAQDDRVTQHCGAVILQDPAFWQALGKARGWDDKITYGVFEWSGSPYHQDSPAYFNIPIKKWEYHAFRYLEVKLSGGDLNQFFESLP